MAAVSTEPPITGWQRIQPSEKVIIKSGILIRMAPKNTIMPAVPARKPPTMGRQPRTCTKGLKKMYIPRAIAMKKTNLSRLVSVVFFFTDSEIIYCALYVPFSIKLISVIGFNISATFAQQIQHCASSPPHGISSCRPLLSMTSIQKG